MLALAKIRDEAEDELHYSGVFSVAQKDVAKLKEIMTKALEAALKNIQSSPEEEVCVLCFDLFRP